MRWEKVMGLRFTFNSRPQSKIFSSSSTTFGADPNKHTNPLDMALPGTLPVLNHEAVTKAIIFDSVLALRSARYPALKKLFLSRPS